MVGWGIRSVAVAAALLAACTTSPTRPPPDSAPLHFAAGDGALLPARCWEPTGPARAVIIGVHGINDYRRAFQRMGSALSEAGFAVCAYDQRGFGATAERGDWPGAEKLVRDLEAVFRQVTERYPHRPVFLAGESMGAAVALLAAVDKSPSPPPTGLILSSPATFEFERMNGLYVGALWLGSRLLPNLAMDWSSGLPMTGDPQLAERLKTDPLMIHATRLEVAWGVLTLMDLATSKAPSVRVPTLILHGGKDPLIPPAAVHELALRMVTSVTVQSFPDRYHLLLRGEGADAAIGRIREWLEQRTGPVPVFPYPTRSAAGSHRSIQMLGQ